MRSLSLRPDSPRASPTTTCSSPTAGSEWTRAVIVPSTISRSPMSAAQPPAQSSAAQVTAWPTSRVASVYSCQSAATLGCGVQVAATRPSATGPGKIRSPSPGSRPVPQAKQVGNGCEVEPGYVASAARAVSASTGATGCGSWSARSARATSAPSAAATSSSSSRVTRHRGVQGRRLAEPDGDGRPVRRGRARPARPTSSRRCRTAPDRGSGSAMTSSVSTMLSSLTPPR